MGACPSRWSIAHLFQVALSPYLKVGTCAPRRGGHGNQGRRSPLPACAYGRRWPHRLSKLPVEKRGKSKEKRLWAKDAAFRASVEMKWEQRKPPLARGSLENQYHRSDAHSRDDEETDYRSRATKTRYGCHLIGSDERSTHVA